MADTCTMPLASMSKVTSICGTPRGEGGRDPDEVEVPELLVVGGPLPLGLVHLDADLRGGGYADWET